MANPCKIKKKKFIQFGIGTDTFPNSTDLVEKWTDRILESVRRIVIETKKIQQILKNND